MRKGEAFALFWEDIVFEEKLIVIKKAVSRGENGLYLKETKTKLPRIIFCRRPFIRSFEKMAGKTKGSIKTFRIKPQR